MGILGKLFDVAGSGAGEAIAKPVEAVGNVIDKLFTSEDERLSHAEVMERLKQQPEMAQIELNKVEAAHASVFVAGWRPAIGWVCAASMAVYYVPRFAVGTVMWCIAAWGQDTLPPMPEMGISDILGLVGALLGMSWMRTSEKKSGVSRGG